MVSSLFRKVSHVREDTCRGCCLEFERLGNLGCDGLEVPCGDVTSKGEEQPFWVGGLDVGLSLLGDLGALDDHDALGLWLSSPGWFGSLPLQFVLLFYELFRKAVSVFVLVDLERVLNPPFISRQSVEQMVLLDSLCHEYIGLLALARGVVIRWFQFEVVLG